MSAILQKLTNYVQSQSHRIYPENWEGEGWLPVPPEFEAIAVANAPYIDVIYSDDGKTITSITPAEKPEPEPEPVEVARAAKVAEISTACSAAIDAGTSVDLPSGSRESFTYTVADQANVSEMFTACLAGATGYIYHANDGPCKTYPVADIVAIYSTLSMYKTGQLTYHNQLKQYVLTPDNPEAVKAVTYGQALTGIYLEQYNTLMAEAQEQMQAVLSRLGGGSDAADG